MVRLHLLPAPTAATTQPTLLTDGDKRHPAMSNVMVPNLDMALLRRTMTDDVVMDIEAEGIKHVSGSRCAVGDTISEITEEGDFVPGIPSLLG